MVSRSPLGALRRPLYTSIGAFGVAAMGILFILLFILMGLGIRDVSQHVVHDGDPTRPRPTAGAACRRHDVGLFRHLDVILQFVERTGAPELLPIFRSRQQAELLADILDSPEREQSLAELTRRLQIPTASIHREVERAEAAGLIRSRRVGKARLVRADTSSPYYAPLRQLLVSAFGVPARLRRALEDVAGVESAYIYGSWAARWHGEAGTRPVGDIDLLVLGDPDRSELYAAVHEVGLDIGREIQAQIRPPGWLDAGTGSFHDTIVNRPMVKVLPFDGQDRNDDASSTARPAS